MLLRNLSEVYKKGLLSMSDLYKRIEDLCKENAVTITSMCKESGASRASLTDLKMGRKQKLSADTLSKIARYFNVSVDYLLGSKTEKAPTLTAKDERDIAKTMELLMVQLSDGDSLMFDGDPMSDEARASILSAMQLGLEAAKVKNKATYTPNKYKKG